MNIVFGIIMSAITLCFALSYKVRSACAGQMFFICMAVSTVMLFSVQTFGNIYLILMTLAELLIFSFLIFLFRVQLRRDAAAAKKRARKAKCASAPRKVSHSTRRVYSAAA